MRRAWLDGDLEGVAPRAELALLRQTLVDALDADEDVTELVVALTRLDPVAGAELMTGARAVAHPRAVRASLQVAAELEGVLPVAGLYRRFADLAPELLVEILHAAASRHLDADWWWRLAGRERIPGETALRLVALGAPDRAPHRALDHDYREAVVQLGATGHVQSLRAVHDRCGREVLLRTLLRTLDAGVDVPLVPWLAAWHGPDIDPLFAAVARRLSTPTGREILGRQASDLPLTTRALRGG